MSDQEDVKFSDLFNPNSPRSDQELIQYRLEICKQCKYLNAKLMKCTKCGCFMKLKSTLKQAKCPIQKW